MDLASYISDKIKSFTKGDEDSKEIAKQRLKKVLTHDRILVGEDLIPLDKLKSRIIEAISPWVEIEEDKLELQLSKMIQSDDTVLPSVIANMPIKNIFRKASNN